MANEIIGLSESQKKARAWMVFLAFILFSAFLAGMFWLSTAPTEAVSLMLSYAAGLSMIFLPCTLPLVFIVVPLSMGHGYKKGLAIAALFGLGLSITLSFYGVAIALLGGWLGLTRATEWMFMLAGGAAFIFGLAELKLLKVRMPAYGGRTPKFIEEQGDYLKALFLGLFLGNAGVGCPNPAFYVLLTYIATVGDVFQGWYLAFIHGIGRATPLLFLSILGILGVNATQSIVKRKLAVEKFIGWALAYIGAFIFMNGAFGHDWYVQSGIHGAWEKVVEITLGAKFGEIIEHTHVVKQSGFMTFGNYVLVFLFTVPLIWYFFKRRKEIASLPPETPPETVAAEKDRLRRFGVIAFIVILLSFFAFTQLFPKIVLPLVTKEPHSNNSR